MFVTCRILLFLFTLFFLRLFMFTSSTDEPRTFLAILQTTFTTSDLLERGPTSSKPAAHSPQSSLDDADCNRFLLGVEVRESNSFSLVHGKHRLASVQGKRRHRMAK